MKPSDLTVQIVREELEFLIKNYPDRTGSVPEGDPDFDDSTCVYYTDENGEPITIPAFADEYEQSVKTVVLTTPVCIVGLWIDSFHPEFKDDEVIRSILIRNGTMRHQEGTGFNPDVKALLSRAQDQQDSSACSTWDGIDLDWVDPYYNV